MPKRDAIDVPVLHRGAGWAAISKPAGLSVVAERNRPGETPLLDAAARALGAPEVLVVHRLDRETSGVLLVATEAEAHRALSLLFQRREVEKTYLAIVRGEPARDEFTIDAPLEKDPGGGSLMRVARRPGEGKPSATALRTLVLLLTLTLLLSSASAATRSSRPAPPPAASTRSASTSATPATRWPWTRSTAAARGSSSRS